MEKDERFYKEVKEYIQKKAMSEFGYCGLAEGEKACMLNTGKGNIIINMKMD